MPGSPVTTPGYMVRSSGMVQGGGPRQARTRRNVARGGKLRHMPDVRLSDTHAIRHLIPPFDKALEFEYTSRELLILAEKFLLEDPKPANEAPAIHHPTRMLELAKREIYCTNGVPDPAINSGMYWRTHPNGRKWLDADRRRETAASFYQ